MCAEKMLWYTLEAALSCVLRVLRGLGCCLLCVLCSLTNKCLVCACVCVCARAQPVIQAMHLVTPNTDVLASETMLASVREMYAWFQPLNTSRITWGKFPKAGMHAKRLIHACRWVGMSVCWHLLM